MTLQESGTTLDGKVKNGNFSGKVQVTNLVQVALPDLNVGDDHTVSVNNITVQYLLPPLLPLFQFQ
jgi:hypothetical protein